MSYSSPVSSSVFLSPSLSLPLSYFVSLSLCQRSTASRVSYFVSNSSLSHYFTISVAAYYSTILICMYRSKLIVLLKKPMFGSVSLFKCLPFPTCLSPSITCRGIFSNVFSPSFSSPLNQFFFQFSSPIQSWRAFTVFELGFCIICP